MRQTGNSILFRVRQEVLPKRRAMLAYGDFRLIIATDSDVVYNNVCRRLDVYWVEDERGILTDGYGGHYDHYSILKSERDALASQGIPVVFYLTDSRDGAEAILWRSVLREDNVYNLLIGLRVEKYSCC